MPALNQRGPMGEGPMTGRKMGRCTNYGTALKNQEVPQDQNQTESPAANFPGRGFGRGVGQGVGRGRRMGGRGRGMGRMNCMRGEY